MNKELQDLHLKAMLWDVTNMKDAYHDHHYYNIRARVTMPRLWNDGVIHPSSLSVDAYNNHSTAIEKAEEVDRVREVLFKALAERDDLNVKYADVIALSTEEIKRLKGGKN